MKRFKEFISDRADTNLGSRILWIIYFLLKRIIAPALYIALAVFVYRAFTH